MLFHTSDSGRQGVYVSLGLCLRSVQHLEGGTDDVGQRRKLLRGYVTFRDLLCCSDHRTVEALPSSQLHAWAAERITLRTFVGKQELQLQLVDIIVFRVHKQPHSSRLKRRTTHNAFIPPTPRLC